MIETRSSLFPDDRRAGSTRLRQVQLVELRILRIVNHLCSQHDILYWLDGGTLLGAVRHRGFIPWDDDIDIVMPRPDYLRFIEIAKTDLPNDLSLQILASDPFDTRFSLPCRIRDKRSLVLEAHKTNIEDAHMGIFIDVLPSDKYHKSGILAWRDKFFKNVYFYYCDYIHGAKKPANSLTQRLKNVLFACKPIVRAFFPIGLLREVLLKTAISNDQLVNDYRIGYSFDSKWRRYFEPADIFPLKKLMFEGYEFSAPNNTDNVLRVFYGGNYMVIPDEKDRAPPHFTVLRIDEEPSDSLE